MLTALIDYDSGNLHSAAKAFERMSADLTGEEVIVTSDADDIRRADRIVLPGDGAFPACKRALTDRRGIFDALVEGVEKDAKPFLGICVGMQMMATKGLEYEDNDGLDWIGGNVQAIAPSDTSLKVPHMGWNDLVFSDSHPVLEGLTTGDHAYFVHSYHFAVTDPAQRLAHVDYGGDVTAIVGTGTIIGTQFHPEKSQATGLRLISNFLKWRP